MIPPAMKKARRWLLAAPDKQPFYVDGTLRRGKLDTPDDQARLATYQDAQAALAGCGQGWRLGFALGPDGDGCWQGIDLDKIEANGLEGLAEMLPGYVERSPSGTGLHAIGYGRPFRSLGPNTSGVEAYSSKRFFVVTGDMIRHNGLGCVADFVERELAGWHGSAVPKSVPSTMAEPTALQLASRELLATPQLISELRSALSCIPADDYGLWIRMGHAIKTLGDAGRDLWHDWSAKSDKYEPEQAQGKWVSFAPDETGYAAIFAEAKRRGWGQTQTVHKALQDPIPLDLRTLPKVPPAIPFIIPGWLPQGVVTLFGAHGGAGKSFVSLFVAVCLAAGWHPFQTGQTVQRRRVIFYSAEDSTVHLQARLRRYLDQTGIAASDLEGWLLLLDATASDNVLFRSDKSGHAPTLRFAWLANTVQRFGADLLIFDNASDALDANENDRAAVRAFFAALRQIAPTVLLLSHVDAASSMARPDKAKGYSGSTAWHNSARSRWFLTKESDGTLILQQPKVNYARAGSEVMLRWNDAHQVFIVVGTSEQKPDAVHHRADLLELLARAIDEGETISPHPTATNNLFRALSCREAFPARLDRSGLYKELAAWKRLGLVRVENYQGSNRQARLRLALTDEGRQLLRAGEAKATYSVGGEPLTEFELQF